MRMVHRLTCAGRDRYVRLAPKAKRCFLIDTGCGLGSLRGFIEEHINT